MGLRLTVRTEGADAIIRRLEAHAEKHQQPKSLLLEVLAQEGVTAFQANIRSEGSRLSDRGISWPPLHPVTQKIRRHYGHGSRMLVRSGDLLHSIRPLTFGDDHVDIGTSARGAYVDHHGGTVDRRQVPARPFLLPTVQDADDWIALTADYYTPAA